MIGIPSCKELYQQTKSAKDLSTIDRFRNHIHLLICKNCQNFHGTMEVIEKAMKSSADHKAHNYSHELTKEIASEVKEHIRSKNNNS